MNSASHKISKQVEAAYLQLAEARPGFHRRVQQKEMIDTIVDTLSGSDDQPHIAAIEGQTGTGKTLGYLLSAIPSAMAREKTLVIATATTALQSQLVENELPAAIRDAKLKATFRLAVGRGRYACPFRLAMALGEGGEENGLFEDDIAFRSAAPNERALMERLHQLLSDGKWSGCRDDLREPLDDILWARIASTGYSCPTPEHCGGRCPFHKAREGLRECDVIVANHDLVLCDLAMGGGAVLTQPEKTIYVFDEAHNLPAKAVEHARAEMHTSRLDKDLTQLPELLRLANRSKQSIDSVHLAQQAAAELRHAIGELTFREERRQLPAYRAQSGAMPAAILAASERLLKAVEDAQDALRDIKKTLDDEKPSVDQRLLVRLGMFIDRLDNDHALLSSYAATDDPGQPPQARWIIREANGYLCFSSPITAALTLQKQLWRKAAGVIMTSATLTSLNRWSRFRAKTGLSSIDVTYRRIASPFDYTNIAELHIPAVRATPKNSDRHTQELITRIPDLLQKSGEGTLVLFSSWHQLKAVYYGVPRDLRPRIRCQGQMGHEKLLTSHRQAIATGRPSVLFGLASMAEGLDLPGDDCTHVVIAKLPFAPPTSPVDATRAEWLTQNGRDPFYVMALPDACLSLIQACGRLIRTESDSGRITILDRRLVSARYGASLLDALPPFKRSIEPDSHRAIRIAGLPNDSER